MLNKINSSISKHRKACNGIMAGIFALISFYSSLVGIKINYTVEETYKNFVQSTQKREDIFKKDMYNGMISLLQTQPSTVERDGLIEVLSKKSKYIDTTFYLDSNTQHLNAKLAEGTFKIGREFIQFAPVITAVSLIIERNSPIYIGVVVAITGSAMIIKASIDSDKI